MNAEPEVAIGGPDNPSFIPSAVICSILPREDGQPFTIVNRTHGVYRVWHPGKGEDYKLTPITWKKDLADVGDHDPLYTRKTGVERRKEFTFDGKQIAADLCKEINDHGPGEGSFFGVFVCEGMKPTEAELARAHQVLESYFMQNIAAADASWSNNPKHDLISGIAKRAARYMGLDPADHEWMSKYHKTIPCPGCGERVRPGVAICKSCHAILDEEKAKKLGLLRIPAEEKRSPGRPRKEPATA